MVEASRRERHQVLRFYIAVVAAFGCGSPNAVPIVEARSTSTIAEPPKSGVCRRFEREPIDVGIEHASALALSIADICAISDGKLICRGRSHDAAASMRMPDAVRVAASNERRVCALRSNATLDCFDGEKRFDFRYLERTSGDMLRRTTNLVLDKDTLTLAQDDGSLRTVKIDVGTNERSEIVYTGFPSGTPSERPVRAMTIAHQIGGSARCVLVGNREICSSWRVHETMEMPGPVVAIGGHCALLEDGRVACFRVRTFELGTPAVVATLHDATSIASDDGQGGCAITGDGRWTCFGDLGLVFSYGGIGPFQSPKTIATPEPVAEIAMNDGLACARTKSGRVSCFGCLELAGLGKR